MPRVSPKALLAGGAALALIALVVLRADGESSGDRDRAQKESAAALGPEPTARQELPADRIAPGRASDAPNVVIVQTDDQDLRSLEVMRKTRRKLERPGTRFAHHFAAHPVCCPSRASLFSGQHSHNHGVLSNNAGQHGGYSYFDHGHALPVWLDDAGYATAHVGKYMNGTPKREIPPGWDEWNTTFTGNTEQMYGYSINHNGEIYTYGDDAHDYQTDVLARIGSGIISEWAGDPAPFYLQIDVTAPHVEHVDEKLERDPRPAPRHATKFLNRRFPKGPAFNERDVSDKPAFLRQPRLTAKQIGNAADQYRDRLASLLAVDDLVARLANTLRREDELAETIFIFTSDNGYIQGEHRFGQGKRELWEPSVRVPLVIRGPGFPRGRVARQLTATMDLAPTLLEAAGAEASGLVMDGVPLQPLAADPGTARNREMLFENGVHGSTAIRTHRWVYINHRKGRELYDLRRDPHQLRSLIGSKNPRARNAQRELARRLRAIRDCVGPEEC